MKRIVTPGGRVLYQLAAGERVPADAHIALVSRSGRWYRIHPNPDPKNPRDPNTGDIAGSRSVERRRVSARPEPSDQPRAGKRTRVAEHEQLKPGYRWVTVNGRRVQIRVVHRGGNPL